VQKYYFSRELYKRNHKSYLHFDWIDCADGEEVQFEKGHTVGRTVITGFYIDKEDCIEKEE
jgi:hypothetical protein